MPLAQYLERRFGRRVEGMLDHVSAAAKGEGISIAWDTEKPAPAPEADSCADGVCAI